MPYAPGITDISGQLRAQGRIAGARALGQGIGDFGKDIAEGMRAYQQNQMMASQATAKADAIFQQNPDILQFLTSEAAPSDLAKLYSKRQKDGTLPLKDAATLAQYAETAVGQKKQAQAAALQTMQMQQIMQEMAMKKAQIDQQVKAQAAMAAAFAPKPQITEYGQAINSGTRFEDLGGGQVSPVQNRVISRGGTPTIGEGMVSMARAGVAPPPNMTQFLNTAADYEATQGSIAQRAQAAEAREAAAKADALHKATLAQIAQAKLDATKLNNAPTYGATMDYEVGVDESGKPKTRQAVFDGKRWIDQKTLLSIETETRDAMGNVTGRAPNPVLFGDVGTKKDPLAVAAKAAEAAKGGTPKVPSKPQFVEGKVYTDAKGVRRRYVKGKWETP